MKLRNQRNDLWQALENLSTKSDVWLNGSQFRELNADDVGAEIQAFHRTASSLHRRMPSGATSLLVERVEEWRLRVPALLALGNPAMKERMDAFNKFIRSKFGDLANKAPPQPTDSYPEGKVDHGDLPPDDVIHEDGEIY